MVSLSAQRRVFLQLTAVDRNGVRHQVIDLVAPGFSHAELTSGQARAVAERLIVGSEVCDVASAVQMCRPLWCVDHRDLVPSEPGALVEHYGPILSVKVSGLELSAAVGVRVKAVDIDADRRVFLELMLPGALINLSSAQACKIASHLLDSADIYDGMQ
jgi:hypothetical protein